MDLVKSENKKLIADVRTLIESAQQHAAITVNAQMTILYWNIGKRIKKEILKSERAEYGKNLINLVAQQLSAEFGKGFTRFSLSRMISFYECFSDSQIVATVSQQLTWSHIVELLPLKTLEKCQFYAYMAIESGWSVRDLRHNIHRMTYERTIANQGQNNINLLECTLSKQIIQPNLVLKDPYVLEFLGLPEKHYENELEEAILKEIEKFILELGTGFSFVARQKRITIDNDHFYLDLLFYNRKLKRTVAIELKAGKFKPEYKGQMELYLGYLKNYEMFEGEFSPIGIILCTEKSSHQIELLNMNESGIHVAEYWTELPPKEVFERKVQEIVLHAKESLTKLNYEDQQSPFDNDKIEE